MSGNTFFQINKRICLAHLAHEIDSRAAVYFVQNHEAEFCVQALLSVRLSSHPTVLSPTCQPISVGSCFKCSVVSPIRTVLLRSVHVECNLRPWMSILERNKTLERKGNIVFVRKISMMMNDHDHDHDDHDDDDDDDE